MVEARAILDEKLYERQNKAPEQILREAEEQIEGARALAALDILNEGLRHHPSHRLLNRTKIVLLRDLLFETLEGKHDIRPSRLVDQFIDMGSALKPSDIAKAIERLVRFGERSLAEHVYNTVGLPHANKEEIKKARLLLSDKKKAREQGAVATAEQFLSRAEAFEGAGDLEKALGVLDEGLEVHDESQPLVARKLLLLRQMLIDCLETEDRQGLEERVDRLVGMGAALRPGDIATAIKKLAWAGELDTAERFAKQVSARECDQNAEVQHAISILYTALERWTEADRAWEQLEALAPDKLGEARAARAKIQLRLGFPSNAEELYFSLLATEPQHREALVYCTTSALDRTDFARAESIIAECVRSHPADPTTRYLELIFAVRNGVRIRARRKAILFAGQFPEEYILHADILKELVKAGWVQEAFQFIRSLPESSLYGGNVYKHWLDLSRKHNEPIDQLSLVNRLMARLPPKKSLYLNKARILGKFREWDEAALVAMQGLEHFPSATEFWRMRIQALRELGLFEEVEQTLRLALKSALTHAKNKEVCQSKLYMAAGRYEQVLEVSNPQNAGSARTSELERLRGQAFLELGLLDDAIGHLKHAALADENIEIKGHVRALERARNAHAQRIPSASTSSRLSYPGFLFEAGVLLDVPICETGSGVCHVNWSLGPGGGERQLAYTVAAQLSDDQFDPRVRVKSLSQIGSRDFFLNELIGLGIDVEELPNFERAETVFADQVGLADANDDALAILNALPADARQIAMPLYLELCRRPARILHLWQDLICVAGGLAGMLAGTPKIIMSTRSTPPLERDRTRPYYSTAYRHLLATGRAALINNSQYGASRYAEWLEIDKARVAVVPNGYEFAKLTKRTSAKDREDVRRRLGCDGSTYLIGGAMRLTAEKNPSLWLETTALLLREDPNMKAVLVGAGRLRPPLEERIHELGLESRIIMVGNQNPVEPWLDAMDLLFLSSVREGLPNVLIEAQALGTLVAATDVGGVSETFDDGATGCLVDAQNSAEKIAEQIKNFIVKTDANAARQRAASDAHQKFGIEASLSKLAEIYA